MAIDPSAHDSAAAGRRAGPVFFQRQEFQRLLSLYGRMVAAGEWRDYSIEPGPEACAFSVFRRAAESPLYRIEKRPALARLSLRRLNRPRAPRLGVGMALIA